MKWIQYLLLCLILFSQCIYALNPKTIPALQEWTQSVGSYTFSANSRIILNTADADKLMSDAKVFQDDLLALTQKNIPIIRGALSCVLPGDIFLSLGSTEDILGNEGYRLSVGEHVAIIAKDNPGVFYGTRTILQLLKQSYVIPAGTARDFPRYPLRALHVDNGRKFFTVEWLKNHIKELAYFKMNLFHWHLSEWSFFRLESDSHPEIVAKEHYSKKEVKELLDLATKYHVTIMPEFEMPGHMNWMLASHPNLQVMNSDGYQEQDNLDLTKDESYQLVKEILTEWVPLFPGPYIHIGTDEYISDYKKVPQYEAYAKSHIGSTANAKDVYLNFINWANDIIRSFGKSTWAWDDQKTGGSLVTLNKNIIYDSWTYEGGNELEQGHQILNTSFNAVYFTWHSEWEPQQTQLYEAWAPNQWSYGDHATLPAYTKGLLGAKLALWFDKNQGEEYSLSWLMKNPMRTMAQQTWASPKLVATYSDFKILSDTLGRAPGTTFPNTAPPIVKPNGPYFAKTGEPIQFKSAGSIARDGTLVKYHWDFGDGGSSEVANPIYIYKRPGEYLPDLFITDSNGMVAANYANVTISDKQSPGENLALNKPTTASSEYSADFAARMATDDDPNNTRWCARNGEDGQWLKVDLGAVLDLAGTEVKWESEGVWQYKIEVSQNDHDWVTVVDKTLNGDASQIYKDKFVGKGRYVRVFVTKNQPGHWASIYDFVVLGGR